MEVQERINEVMNLRFALKSKSRMRLEFLGELSKILRIHGHSINDEVLSSLILAVPEELPGEGIASMGNVAQVLNAESPASRPPGKEHMRPPGGEHTRPPGGEHTRPPGDKGESRPPGKKEDKKDKGK